MWKPHRKRILIAGNLFWLRSSVVENAKNALICWFQVEQLYLLAATFLSPVLLLIPTNTLVCGAGLHRMRQLFLQCNNLSHPAPFVLLATSVPLGSFSVTGFLGLSPPLLPSYTNSCFPLTQLPFKNDSWGLEGINDRGIHWRNTLYGAVVVRGVLRHN